MLPLHDLCLCVEQQPKQDSKWLAAAAAAATAAATATVASSFVCLFVFYFEIVTSYSKSTRVLNHRRK